MMLLLAQDRGQRRVQTLLGDHLVEQQQKRLQRDGAHLSTFDAAYCSLGDPDARPYLGLRDAGFLAKAKESKGSLAPCSRVVRGQLRSDPCSNLARRTQTTYAFARGYPIMPEVWRVADMTPKQLRGSIQSSVFIANVATWLVISAVAVGIYVLTR